MQMILIRSRAGTAGTVQLGEEKAQEDLTDLYKYLMRKRKYLF